MLGYIYDFIYTYLWYPLEHELGLSLNYTINGDTVSISEWLSLITCIVCGVLIIWLLIMILCKVFRWFSGFIGK